MNTAEEVRRMMIQDVHEALTGRRLRDNENPSWMLLMRQIEDGRTRMTRAMYDEIDKELGY